MKQRSIYLYVGMGTVMMLLLGIVYSYSIFRREIVDLYHVNQVQSGLPFMFVLLFYAVWMAISGILYDRFSTTKIALIGVALIGSGFILTSFATSITLITLFYGVLIGSGIGILYGLPLRIVAQLNHSRPGLLTGITLMGFGLSPLIFAPQIQYLLDTHGLSQTFLILGIFFLVVLFVLTIFLVRKDTKPKSQTKVSFTFLKNTKFYKVYFLFFIGTFIGLSIIGFTAEVGDELLGISNTDMALLIGVFAIFNGIGRPLFGALNDHFNFSFTASISYLSLIIVSVLYYFFSHNMILFIVSFILFYMNFGGWLSLAPSATIQLFGKERYSQVYGFMFTAYGLGAFIGNGVSGILTDSFSYEAVFIVTAILAFVGFITVRLTFKNSPQ